MRIAAGILLIVLGVLGLVVPISVITAMPDLDYQLSLVPVIVVRIVYAAFIITGGIFCLRRKYWRVCLASASFGVLLGVLDVAEPLVSFGRFATRWDIWVVFIAAVIATIFIAVTKREWQKISDSVDSEVSKGG